VNILCHSWAAANNGKKARPLAPTVLEPSNRTHRTDKDRDAEDVYHANERMIEDSSEKR